MIKNFIIKLLLLGIFIALALWAFDWLVMNNPGYVVIAINQTTLEVNLWFAVVGLVFTIWGLRFIKRFFRAYWRIGKRLVGIRSYDSYVDQTAAGLLAFLQNQPERAERRLLKVLKRSPMPLVNLLVAVRCAEIRGNRERGLQLIEKYGSQVDDDYYLALARADILSRLGNHEESWTILDGLQENHKRDPALLERLISAAIARQELNQAQQWLASLRKAVEQERWLPLQHAIASAKMQEIASSDSDQKDTLLETYWLSLSRKTREDWPTFTAYLQALSDIDAHVLSEKALREWVQKRWSEPAVLAYGSLTSDRPEKLKKTAASWLKAHPDDWALYLTLGRLAVLCEDFEEAKSYFIKSLELLPNEAAYLELAQLLHQLDEFSASQEAYQKAIACRTETVKLASGPAHTSVASAS